MWHWGGYWCVLTEAIPEAHLLRPILPMALCPIALGRGLLVFSGCGQGNGAHLFSPLASFHP